MYKILYHPLKGKYGLLLFLATRIILCDTGMLQEAQCIAPLPAVASGHNERGRYVCSGLFRFS